MFFCPAENMHLSVGESSERGASGPERWSQKNLYAFTVELKLPVESGVLVGKHCPVVYRELRWIPPTRVAIGIEEPRIVTSGHHYTRIVETAHRAVRYKDTRDIESGEFIQSQKWMFQADVGVDEVAVYLERFQGKVHEGRRLQEDERVQMHRRVAQRDDI
jgi:hypothetical protein